MKPLFALALALLLPFPLVACGDDEAGCPSLRPGLWRAKYTLRADSDAACQAVPDRTLEIGDESDLSGDSTLSCESGCTCSQRRDTEACTVESSSFCFDYGQSCTYEVVSGTTVRASCEVFNDTTDCTVDILITWESEAL